MIPYPYNMVDMGGIDLAEANGTVVDGLYAKIVEAVNSCGDTVLYNWKFAGIEIAPQHTQILLGVSALTINTLIQVTEQDVVTVLGIAPPPPPVVPVEPLDVYENGVYTATPPSSGFNPVNVAVPSKVLVPLSVSEPGVYVPSDYDADGFSEVTVTTGPQRATRVWTHSTGGTDASVYVQPGIYENEVFVPSGDVVDLLYTNTRDWVGVGIVQVKYGSPWQVRGIYPVQLNGNPYPAGQVIVTWQYNVSVDYLFIELQ